MLLKKEHLIKLLLIFSFLSIILGTFTISHKYINIHKENKIKKEKINNYLNIKNNNQIYNDNKYNYIAILEIPSINLTQGLVDMNNKYNDINYNIAILNTSKMPDIDKSNLILASHNGNTNVSYFNDLYKMNKDDFIYVYYKNYKYIYKYHYYYEVNKTGNIKIIRDSNKTTITLITCKNNSTNQQLVFIGYLIDKIKY